MTSSYSALSKRLGQSCKYFYSVCYASLWYHLGQYQVSQGQSDTYSVEADNAELRHDLARLARSSRCFSRCPHALEYALTLFVFCCNSRPLHKRQFPAYPAHLIDFIGPSFQPLLKSRVNISFAYNFDPVNDKKVIQKDDLFVFNDSLNLFQLSEAQRNPIRGEKSPK